MIVLDACVLIALLDGNDPHHSRAVTIMNSHADEGFATNVLTAAEAYVHPAIAGKLAEAETAFDSLELDILPIQTSAASSLAALRAAHNIRLPDAVILHTAITTSQRLVTFDDQLVKAALQVGVVCHSW